MFKQKESLSNHFLFYIFFISLFYSVQTYSDQTSAYSIYFKQINEAPVSLSQSNIYLREDTLYVFTSSGMLASIGIGKPYQTLKVNSFNNILNGIDIAFNGYYAYIASTDGKINIYDFSQKERPLKNSIDVYNYVNKIAISDGLLYCTQKDAGLLNVYDITNPAFPLLKGNQIITGTPNSLFVKNRNAYIATSTANIMIINSADLSKLPIVGNYNFGIEFYDVFVSDNFAYVSQGSTGVQVLNVVNTSKPVWVTNLFSRKFSKQVFVSNYYTYVNDDNTIQAFYNRDPTNQLIAGSFDNKGVSINRIYVNDGKYVYVSSGDGKLKILEIQYNY